MKYLLQRPLPDEFLTSALVRTCRRFDLSIGSLMKGLTGRKYSPSLFQVSGATQLAQCLALDVEQLLKRHSVLTYVSAFQPAGDARRCLEMATSGPSSPLGLSAWIQSASMFVRERRLCKKCYQEDRKNFGTSYWHVSHNLPGSIVCSIHTCRLHVTELPTSGRTGWSYLLPGEVKQRQLGRGTPSSFEVLLTEEACRVQGGDWGCHGMQPVGWFKNLLVANGWSSSDRPLNSKALTIWIRDVIGRSLPLTGMTGKDQELGWVALIARDLPGIPFPTLKHLIVTTAISVRGKTDRAILDYVPSGLGRRDFSARDERYASALGALVASNKTLRGVGQGTTALKTIGAWGSFRHSRERYPLLKQALSRLSRRGGV